MADKQSRKWQLTINNPAEKGLDHEAIKKVLEQFKSCVYWCMADEVGLDTHTAHTHLFFCLKSPAKFYTVKKRFPEAHIEAAHGTVQENRDYVCKSGKWSEDEKADTSVPGTFEEWGEPPEEPGQGARTDIVGMYHMIAEEGLTNADVMERNPELAAHIGKMDKIRQLREGAGLTIEELAVKVGVNATTLGRMEKGQTQKIGDDVLTALAREFNVSTDFLLGLTSIPDRKNYDIAELGLLYRYGFTDGDEHPIPETAAYFHLTEKRAKKTERAALDDLRSKLPR